MMDFFSNVWATAGPVMGWSLLGFVILLGLGLDMLGLFGNWIILGAFGIQWGISGFAHYGWLGMGGMLALAVVGEALEAVMAGYGAHKFGGSKGGMVAALVGCLVGAAMGTPLFPLVGTLFGACAGAFVGAATYEYLQHEKEPGEALWTGLGAALGKIGGMIAKFTCGLLMLAVAWFTY